MSVIGAQISEAMRTKASTDLAVRGDNTDLAGMTLEVLARVINGEHQAVVEGVQTTLRRAIRAGEALLQAQTRVPATQWISWLTDNTSLSKTTSGYYQRLAYYQDQIEDPEVSIHEATDRLRGLPRRPAFWYPAHVREEAVRLRQEGLTLVAIGERLGVPFGTVHNWNRPPEVQEERKRSERERRGRDKKARAALAAQEKQDRRNVAAARSGKEVSKAYAELRSTLDVLDQAILAAGTPQAQSALRRARDHLYKAEDQFAAAFGVE